MCTGVPSFKAWSVGLLCSLSFLFPKVVMSQFSPGSMSSPHSQLEGSSNCSNCHERGRGVSATLCLDCHGLLALRIRRGEGLHVQPGYDACQTCHVDHQGREFDLIWWGDEGIEAFDHELTGHALVGAHSELECRSCHESSKVRDSASLRSAGKDLDRTFLGLGTTCSDCHQDVHESQFENRGCESCHSQVAFANAEGFDHQDARFHLTGQHIGVACSECHEQAENSAGDPFVRYAGLAFRQCTACHSDPHETRLGPECSSCHSTASWQAVDQSGFDHARTSFPLEGLHSSVGCEECHGATMAQPRPAHDACLDCHTDPHLGQFAHRGGEGCTECHSEQGFLPSTFTREKHAQLDFELLGAHLRVECESCHTETALDAAGLDLLGLDRRNVTADIGTAQRFHFDRSGCIDCHADPHQLDRLEKVAVGLGGEACLTCHDASSWFSTVFEHRSTGYTLEEGHLGLQCSDCHEAGGEPVGGSKIADFSAADSDCMSCHSGTTPHRGQFTESSHGGECASCHEATVWSEVHFDHDRDSRFLLEGAHREAKCAQCHPTHEDEAGSFVRYRPIESSCESCHANGLER